jgi:hypothetical protein
MGCGPVSPSPPRMGREYTYEGAVAEIQGFVPRLPAAELVASGTIKLKGVGCFFNPAPPADEDWLQGAMSAREYSMVITAIKDAAAQCMVGETRMFRPGDIPHRQATKASAVRSECEGLNQHWSARRVKLTFAEGQEDIKIIGLDFKYGLGYNGDVTNAGTTTVVQHTQDCFLYIAIK